MVVSDCYGLRRYQTGDLFECRRRFANRTPDLAFLRRRALEYSFSGEKVTAEQLNAVFNQLRAQFPEAVGDAFLTCIPSLPPTQNPHYKFVAIRDSRTPFHTDLMASHCDRVLSELNCEYNNKRLSGSLGPARFIQVTTAEFAERFADSWETQFKFLPLYRRTWESTNVPHVNVSNIPLSHKNTRQLTQAMSLQ